MADVLLDDVSRVFADGSEAVSHLSLHVRNAELMVIVGPSGCGKSTVLRLIAGLDPLRGGTISIGGRVVNHLTPGERNVAMVFEAAALYPHLTAAQNLRFGLAMRKLPSDEIQQRVEAETRVLRLGRFLDRKPKTLSAGPPSGSRTCSCSTSRSPTWTPASGSGSAPSWPSSSTGSASPPST